MVEEGVKNLPIAEKSLKPFKTNDKHTIESGRKGGKVRSRSKQAAAKLRDLKRKLNWSNEDLTFFEERLVNPESNMQYMESVLETAIVNGKIREGRGIELMERLHRTRFGEKHHNTNVNVNVSAEDFDKRLFK